MTCKFNFCLVLLLLVTELLSAQRIATGLNSEGCIELFYINQNQELCYYRQLTPGGNWSDEVILNSNISNVCLNRNTEGLLELLYISTDNSLYHSKQLATTNSWPNGSMIRDSVSSMCVITDNLGYLHLFSVLENNAVKYIHQTDTYDNWSSEITLLPFAEKIDAGCNADGRMEIFYTDDNDNLLHKWQLSEGGDWSDASIFSAYAKFMTVARNADGRLEVFFITNNNELHHKWQLSPGGDWSDEAVFYDSAGFVTTGVNDDGRIELLFTNNRNLLMHNWQVAPSSSWGNTEQFGWYATEICAQQNADQRLEVFYLGTDGYLYHRFQTQPGLYWSSEYPLRAERDPFFSFGEYNQLPSFSHDTDWHINDHCFIKSSEGKWHMFGIMYPDPDADDNPFINYFGHATADDMMQIPWTEETPSFYDALEPGGVLWAPHILYHDGYYLMFYCGGGELNSYKIYRRHSRDLITWSNRQLAFQDGFQARDPMVIYVAEINRWVMYYCATEFPDGGNHIVACRTSEDLINWEDRQIVYRDLHTGTDYGPTESPFVIKRGEYYYLFIGPRPYDYPSWDLPNWEHPGYVGTDVFRSTSWNNWTNADYVGWIDAHAPEIVQDDDGSWYISNCGVKQGGLFIREMFWHDGITSEEQNNTINDIEITTKPNPLIAGTSIVFKIPALSEVQIEISDITGRTVRQLIDERMEAGENSVYWDGQNNSGTDLQTGIYLGIVRINGKPYTTKMLLNR